MLAGMFKGCLGQQLKISFHTNSPNFFVVFLPLLKSTPTLSSHQPMVYNVLLHSGLQCQFQVPGDSWIWRLSKKQGIALIISVAFTPDLMVEIFFTS